MKHSVITALCKNLAKISVKKQKRLLETKV